MLNLIYYKLIEDGDSSVTKKRTGSDPLKSIVNMIEFLNSLLTTEYIYLKTHFDHPLKAWTLFWHHLY